MSLSRKYFYTSQEINQLYNHNETLEMLGDTLSTIINTVDKSIIDYQRKYDGASLGIIIYENRYIIDNTLYQNYENQINKNNIKINEAIIPLIRS